MIGMILLAKDLSEPPMRRAFAMHITRLLASLISNQQLNTHCRNSDTLLRHA